MSTSNSAEFRKIGLSTETGVSWHFQFNLFFSFTNSIHMFH